MDILPRLKPNGTEFAYYPHRKLVGTTSSRILVAISDRIGYLSSGLVDAAMRVAYNFVAAKHLGCLRIVLFNNVVKDTDRIVILALEGAGLVTIERKPNRAEVMVIHEATNIATTDLADTVAFPAYERRAEVLVRDRATGKPARKVSKALHDIYSKEVALLNTWTDTFHVEYRPSWSKRPVRILPDALRYTRIFLNTFHEYGRFTALFQSLPKADRATMTIGHEPVCEVDFRSMHPTIAYAYGFADPTAVDMYGFLPHLPREHRKLALLISFNARDYDGAVSALTSRTGGTPAYAKALLDAAYDYHGPIRSWFWSDAGVGLMHIESNIAHRALTACRVQNIPALCMHDALICRRRDAAKVAKIMEDSFMSLMGFSCATSIKGQ